jgi:hypothetical protein
MSYALYQTPRHNPKAYKPRLWLSNDTKSNVTSYDRMELVNYSRQLFAQIDVLATAIYQKNNWAFGDAWDAHYTGEDVEWAKRAKDFLDFQFYPYCNRRGPQFDLRTSMRLMGQAWDVDGDDLIILTESEKGFPQFAMYPATRISSHTNNTRGKNGDEVKGGPLAGAKIFDGIILNRDNRFLGARIVDDDGKAYTDIPANNCDFAFEAIWSDQMRGIPKVAPSILNWLSLQDTDQYTQDSVKRAAKVGFAVSNAEGEAPVSNQVITAEDSPASGVADADVVGGMESDRKIHYEETAGGGGEIWYLDATQGEKIEQLDYSNPHPNIEAFIERIRAGALSQIGWHHELLNLGAGGRAPSRVLCDLANRTIGARQATGEKRWKRIIGYALAKAVKSGFLRRPSDPRDYNRWEPGYPKQISVDAGNDAKAALDLMKFGLSTIGIEAAKAGYHPDYIRSQQKKELNNAIADAKELFAQVKAEGMTFQECLQLVRQTNPNPGNSQPAQEKSAPSSGGGNSAKSQDTYLTIENQTQIPAPTKRKMVIRRDASGAVTGAEEV